jgi:hypothetical protein
MRWGMFWRTALSGACGLACTIGYGAASDAFMTLNEPSLPPAVIKSTQSIYRLLVHRDPALYRDRWGIKRTEDYLKEHYEGKKLPFVAAKNCDAVTQCLTESRLTPNAPARCYAPYIATGTAWISSEREGHSVLSTAWHVFAPQFAPQMFLARAIAKRPAKERQTLLKGLAPLFTLFDAQGKKVFSADREKMAQFVNLGDFIGAEFTKREERLGAELLEDYVSFEVPTRLGAVLPKVKASPEEKETVYAVGFPTLVKDRKQNGAIASDGHQLYISAGEIYAPDTHHALATQLMKSSAGGREDAAEKAPDEDADYLAKDYRLPVRGRIYASCDTVYGNSGGPLVNKAGEVIGMVTATYSTPQKYERAGSISLYAPHLPLVP